MIKLSNVTFEYVSGETRKKAIDDLSLSIDAGEFVVVLGHNGSGKSTFVKLLNGINIPQKGNVEVMGLSTSNPENIWEIRKLAGMVFQNPDNQIVATSVEEDVAFGLENIGVPTDQMRKRIDYALSLVRMGDLKEKEPHMLSGGQKQRVAIAGVLAMLPKIILLDEPTAMLDPEGRADVMNIIYKLNREYGITIVHITHFMEEAQKATRAIVLNEGKIVLDDTPKNIFNNPKIKEIGLDVPKVLKIKERLQGFIDFSDADSLEGVANTICQSLLNN